MTDSKNTGEQKKRIKPLCKKPARVQELPDKARQQGVRSVNIEGSELCGCFM